jgi:Ca2+-binding RTX toxin-like protein
MATINGTPNQNNYLVGTDGDDLIFGANMKDYILGGAGDDHLYGGKGADHIDGGCGDDFIYAGRAVAVLTGGEGDDTFYFAQNVAGEQYKDGNRGTKVITDFDCGDKAVLDHFNQVTWDKDHGNLLSGQGHVIAHLDGHEGADLQLTHVGQHWEGLLA